MLKKITILNMKRKNKEKEKPAFQGCRVTQRVRNTPALNSDSDGELALKSSGRLFQSTAPL